MRRGKKSRPPKRPPGKSGHIPKERFVAEYMIDQNATQAAIRSGYSPKTAHVQGPRLLGNVVVQQLIAERQKKIANKLEITQERVAQELARIAFSDMAKFATWGPGGVVLKESSELAEDDSRCVAEVTETTSKDGGSVKFKLHDKKGALDSLAKHLGMITDRHEVTLAIESANAELDGIFDRLAAAAGAEKDPGPAESGRKG